MNAICFALSQDVTELRASKLDDLFSLYDTRKEEIIDITLIFQNKEPNPQKFPEKEYILNVKVSKDSLKRTFTLNNKKISSSNLKEFLYQIGISMNERNPSFIIQQNSVMKTKK